MGLNEEDPSPLNLMMETNPVSKMECISNILQGRDNV
jgi:hypothetical protein